MKTKSMRSIAFALGLGVCTVTQADDSYVSPANWNNFRTATAAALVNAQEATELPAPVAEIPAPVGIHETQASPYAQAMSGSWDGCGDGSCEPTRLPLAPYFGSVNLLFFDLEENMTREFTTGLGNFNSNAVQTESSTGFDVSMGRYLDCGRYGLGITYMLWNPSAVTEVRTGAAGTIRASMPAYNFASIDPDGAGVLTAGTVYAIIDGSDAGYAGATGARATRDVRFQGVEANLYSFGLMGARRASYSGCNSGSKLGNLFGLNGSCNGYGGAAGPLARACNGRVRVMTSHGFRWMQVNDDLELAYNIDGTVGYQATDIYENVDIENNLYGYQFGGRLTYCMSKRLSMNIGGKFGIYANDVEKTHRLGSQTDLAFRTGTPADVISTRDTDVALATLGELDLGLGYRIGNAWTVRGGYRLMGITGVATAWDSLPNSYASLTDSGRVNPNDSYLLHGGYVGLEYNW